MCRKLWTSWISQDRLTKLDKLNTSDKLDKSDKLEKLNTKKVFLECPDARLGNSPYWLHGIPRISMEHAEASREYLYQ